MSGRITGDMSLINSVDIIAGGNPGSIELIKQMAAMLPALDLSYPTPNDALLQIVLDLDTLRLFDDKLPRLYKDICAEDIVLTTALVVCGVSAGGMIPQQLLAALEPGGEKLDIDAIMNKIAEAHPGYISLVPRKPAGTKHEPDEFGAG